MFHFINPRGSRFLEELGRVVLRSAIVGRRTYHNTSASTYPCRRLSGSIMVAGACISDGFSTADTRT